MQHVEPCQHPSTATSSKNLQTQQQQQQPQQPTSLETTSLLYNNMNNIMNYTTNMNTTKKQYKFIVLGAANAGKTSILRQYFYHQFDDNDSHHNTNTTTTTRTRIPTVGSDYYVGRIPIQIPIQEVVDDNDTNNRSTTTTTTTTTNHINHYTSSLSSSSSPTSTSTPLQEQQPPLPQPSSTTLPTTTTIYMNVQMWDTPGKENFTIQQQQQSHNHHHYSYNSSSSSSSHSKRSSSRYNQHQQYNHNNRLQHFNEKFLYNADGIMLVYDMTSSTSFTRLLKWYSTIVDLLQTYNTNQNHSTTTKKSIPIVIVANKFDLYNQWYDNNNHNHTKNSISHTNHPQQQQQQEQQRDVLGLHGIDYYGKHFQYEYQISIQNNSNNNINHNNNSSNNSYSKLSSRKNSLCSSHNSNNNNNDNTITDPFNITNTNYINTSHNTTKRRMEISSYLVNHDNWIQDMSYLESLIQSENESHPDHDMVLLWCQRNALQLITVSAKTGNGIHDAITTLIHLAIQNNHLQTIGTEQQQQQHSYTPTEASITAIHTNDTSNSFKSITTPPVYTKRSNKNRTHYQYNPELDLHARFSTNNNQRTSSYHCFWNWNCDWIVRIIPNLFQNCIR
jgi:GTPase SAR1 family protein